MLSRYTFTDIVKGGILMDEQVKIWQRSRSNIPPATDNLPALAAGSLSRAALYAALSRQMQGPARSILGQLQEEEQQCARCVKGVYRMITGAPMQVAPVPPSFEKTDGALRKCYGQNLKALALCEARAQDPEYGAVFFYLASKKREHCCKLAELFALLGG
jgi:hypothetical protein